jgi:hypothetical protein
VILDAREFAEIHKREEKLAEENREMQRKLRDRESSLNELRRGVYCLRGCDSDQNNTLTSRRGAVRIHNSI